VNLAGIVVRDRQPERFRVAHGALFAARHDLGLDMRERDVVAKVLDEHDVDGASVLAEIDAGWPLDVLRDEHLAMAQGLGVFGVPTFVMGDDAVFVRLMHRPAGDAELARTTIDRVVELVAGWPDLNELKHTRIPR
jgi:2-hydroxychromene-2-carboxylate isomerase